MMRTVVVITLLFSAGLNAQNLVVNPGFEDFEKIDSAKSQWTVITTKAYQIPGWSMPTLGSSDHHYVVGNNSFQQYHHSLQPFEGNCIAGFIASFGYYEYIQGSLSEPLKQDVVYYFSFSLATEFNRDFNEQRIGVCFDTAASPQNHTGLLKWQPAITLDTIANRDISGDWLIYQTWYKAKGGETCFTIGQFIDMAALPRIGMEAYYFFVDDFYLSGKPKNSGDNSIAAGKTLTLQNIYFETGKSRILPASDTALNKIATELQRQPKLKVEIIGHTDKHGTAESNQKLSEQRAIAVEEYFISRGIDASRITTSGKGSSEPVSEEDAKNRRVEFVFSE